MFAILIPIVNVGNLAPFGVWPLLLMCKKAVNGLFFGCEWVIFWLPKREGKCFLAGIYTYLVCKDFLRTHCCCCSWITTHLSVHITSVDFYADTFYQYSSTLQDVTVFFFISITIFYTPLPVRIFCLRYDKFQHHPQKRVAQSMTPISGKCHSNLN